MTENSSNSNAGLMAAVSRYVKLLVEDTRLGLAEKLTRLLSAIAVSAVLVILALVAMVFVSIGISYLLAPVISPVWSFLAVAAFYLVLIAVFVALKRQLVVDPIARFISSLLVEPPVSTPTPTSDNDKPAAIS